MCRSAILAFTAGSELPGDINATGLPSDNPFHWANFWRKPSDGWSPVIYDADGSIIDEMFGVGARFDVLGVSGLDHPSVPLAGGITGASIVINGAFFDGAGMPVSPDDAVSELAFEAIMVHEAGHFAGLDHSVVNHEMANDGDPDNDIYIPTMYPIAVDDEEAIASLNPDDEAAYATLYPSAAFSSATATLTGVIRRPDGLPFQGAHVVAREVSDPRMRAYSGISGARFFPCNEGGICSPCSTASPCVTGDPPEQGTYLIGGTPPGTYSLCVEQIDRRFSISNGTFVGPLATPPTVPGPEECRSLGESGDPALDDPDDVLLEGYTVGSFSGLDIMLNELPSSDGFEPNDSQGAASTLTDLAGGMDTAPAMLTGGDLDFYRIPVQNGQVVRIDVDASELGSPLDAAIGIYGPMGLIRLVDDAIHPDSSDFTLDPALTYTADFTGDLYLAVSSYPDLDLNGSGGATTGPYWLRIIRDSDQDSDGVPDRLDRCPDDAADDPDDDMLCGAADNCPTVYNFGAQQDEDSDGVGDACDNCSSSLPAVFDFESGAGGWVASGTNSTWHLASSTCTGTPLPSTMFVSNGNRGPSCLADSSTETSQLTSPTLHLPGLGLIRLTFDVLAFDELGSCSLGGGFDTKDARITFGGPFDILNNCYPLATSSGVINSLAYDLSGYAGQDIGIVFDYRTGDSAIGDTFAVDNVVVEAFPGTQNPGQEDADGDGIGDACDTCPLDPFMDADLDGVCGDVDNCPTLFNPAQDGGLPARINNAMVSGGDIYGFTPAAWSASFTPDSQRVVYMADQDTDNVVEIYSAPSGGGGAVRLNNPALPIGREVLDYAISPDSSNVVFRSDQTADKFYTLRSVPVAGGAATEITTMDTLSYAVSADSTRVVFIANTDPPAFVPRLFSVPIAGGAETELNGPIVVGGEVVSFLITPDGSRVVFLADKDVDEQYELYSVPIAGGTVTRLHGSLDPGADVTDYRISPDGAWVVFEVVDFDFASPSSLWSVPVTGGTPVVIGTGGGHPGGFFRISPDSTRVVHIGADADTDLQLYSYSILGGDSLQLTFGIVSSGPRDFRITPDSSTIVYIYQDNLMDGIQELRSIPILGGSSLLLSGPMISGGGVLLAEITPGGARAVYRAKQDSLNADLYSVPVTGGMVTKLNPAGPFLDEDDPLGMSSDGATVVFRTAASPNDVYSVPVIGGPLIKVNPTPVASGTVEADFRIAPDGSKVMYIADQIVNDVTELWTTALLSDPDLDGIYSICDGCPNVPDASQPDADGDGVNDLCDNCPSVPNTLQQDTEVAAGPDGRCDTDDDLGKLFGPDGICGTSDDLVGDGVGDDCAAWTSAATGPLADPASQSVGAAWGDYDNDGDQDIYISSLGSDKLLRNEGGLVFTDATAPPLGDTGSGRAAIWGDYDNDGNVDLFLSNSGSFSRLYHNEGDGSFDSLLSEPVLGPGAGYGAAWADYDKDGDLDLYQVRVGEPNKLFRNDAGTFVDATTAPLDDAGQGRGASWVDYDDDGDLDIFLVNSDSANRLFRNDGMGVFTSVTSPPLTDALSGGRGSTWGDYDNDGDLDVYVTGLGGSKLFRNDSGVFTDVTAGPLGDPGFGTSAAWADYDNDSDLDLYLVNQGGVSKLFRNDGMDGFVDASSGPLGDTGTNFCAAWADADSDGDLDLLLTDLLGPDELFRNDLPPGNHWLHLDLVGTVSNRSGIGARVTTLTGSLMQTREVSGGQAAGCQDSLTVEFGLGQAAMVDTLTIIWPSGTVQILTDVPADQRLSVVEPEFTPPLVTWVLPSDGSIDVALATSIVLMMSEPVDPATADAGVVVARNGIKVIGSAAVSPDGRLLVFDPLGPLQADSDYVVQVNGELKDIAGNPALPFTSTFDTGAAGSGSVSSGEIGTEGGGAAVSGMNLGDATGFSTAAANDVNADGLADALVGAPNADVGPSADAGRVDLVFGSAALAAGGAALILSYNGIDAGEHAGSSVASAGDLNGDGLGDFLIGAPDASPSGAESGRVYLVFGNSGLDELAPSGLSLSALAACAQPTLCGLILDGAAAGDRAGTAVSFAGDVNDDGHDDILIGAPGASPAGRTGAGKVYVLFGPVTPGTVNLSAVGMSIPGLVFQGETAGDQAGAAVSDWQHFTGDMMDDLLIGAPLADTIDSFGMVVTDAGYVYAIHGGVSNLVAIPSGTGIIELSRVADGLPDQVEGVVFLGVEPGQLIGRSVSGEVDIDDDGVPDIMIGADQQAWIIPGDGPKTQTTKSRTTDPEGSPALSRQVGKSNVVAQFSAWHFSAGSDGDLGGVAVAGGGDVNADGVDDAIIGAPGVDLPGRTDAGKAYVIYGSLVRPAGELRLSDVGTTIPGLTVVGAEAMDSLGRSVGGGKDINADGVDDALVGAPLADTQPATPPDAGEAYLISPVLPGEVTDLELTHAGGVSVLEWLAAPLASMYNIYRGDSGGHGGGGSGANLQHAGENLRSCQRSRRRRTAGRERHRHSPTGRSVHLHGDGRELHRGGASRTDGPYPAGSQRPAMPLSRNDEPPDRKETGGPSTCPSCGTPVNDPGDYCPACADTREPGALARVHQGPREIAGFRIIREIGAGGMGTVYEAFEGEMHRRIALKVLSRHESASDRAETRFAREAWIGGRLNHPNLVRVYERGSWQDISFYTMELVNGGSLHDVIRRMRQWGRDETWGLDFGTREYVAWAIAQVAVVARGLDYAHRNGVVHRDIKPMNILLAKDPCVPKIADFGLAVDETETRLTTAGKVLGTIAYMAPEQIRGDSASVNGRTDVYALGVTLFELLTLELPYTGATQQLYMNAVLTTEARRPSKLNEKVGHDLEIVIRKALQKDNKDRYATARDFAEDLENLLAFRPIRARPPTAATLVSKWIRRNPVLAALIMALSIGLPVLVGLGIAQIRSQHALALVEIQDLRDKGTRLAREDRFEQAHDAFSRILVKEPDDLDALRARAWCAYRLAIGSAAPEEHQRMTDLALADLRHAARLAPRASWPPKLSGYILSRLGREAEAQPEEEAARRLRVEPPSDDDLQIDALLAFHSRNWAAAANAYTRFLERRPGNIDALIARGRAYARMENYTEAKVDLQVAAGLNPSDPGPPHFLGKVLTLAGDLDAAERSFRKALALAPGDARIHVDLADTLVSKGKHKATSGDSPGAIAEFRSAEASARRAIELDATDPAARVNLGASLMERYRALESPDPALAREAIAAYGEALALWESAGGEERTSARLDAMVNQCDALIQIRELDSALEACRAIADLDPGNANNFYNLAGVYAMLGRTDDALSALQKDFELGDRDHDYLRADPWFASLRGNRRFKTLLKKMQTP